MKQDNALSGSALVLITTLVGALSALAFCWGLAAMARPADLKARVAALDTKAQRIQTLLRRRGGAHDYPVGSVCPGLADAQLEPIRQHLSVAARAANLNLEKVVVTRSSDADVESIAAVQVRLETQGAYAPTLTMLDTLSRQAPLLYVDQIELRPKADVFTLQLSGRVYCWTAAPR